MKKTILWFVICLLHGQSFAQGEAWTYGQSTDQTSRWASVLNDSGNVFMQKCFPSSETCYWSVALSIGCEKDATFPLLASSNAGATPVSVLCGETFVTSNGRTYHQYFFDDFDKIDNLVRSANGPIGFAMALESGKFLVVRFDMKNAVKAVDSMRALAQFDIDKKPRIKPKIKCFD